METMKDRLDRSTAVEAEILQAWEGLGPSWILGAIRRACADQTAKVRSENVEEGNPVLVTGRVRIEGLRLSPENELRTTVEFSNGGSCPISTKNAVKVPVGMWIRLEMRRDDPTP